MCARAALQLGRRGSQISELRTQNSELRSQISDLKSQISNLRSQIFVNKSHLPIRVADDSPTKNTRYNNRLSQIATQKSAFV